MTRKQAIRYRGQGLFCVFFFAASVGCFVWIGAAPDHGKHALGRGGMVILTIFGVMLLVLAVWGLFSEPEDEDKP